VVGFDEGPHNFVHASSLLDEVLRRDVRYQSSLFVRHSDVATLVVVVVVVFGTIVDPVAWLIASSADIPRRRHTVLVGSISLAIHASSTHSDVHSSSGRELGWHASRHPWSVVGH
jgi:hypothetical protein